VVRVSTILPAAAPLGGADFVGHPICRPGVAISLTATQFVISAPVPPMLATSVVLVISPVIHARPLEEP